MASRNAKPQQQTSPHSPNLTSRPGSPLLILAGLLAASGLMLGTYWATLDLPLIERDFQLVHQAEEGGNLFLHSVRWNLTAAGESIFAARVTNLLLHLTGGLLLFAWLRAFLQQPVWRDRFQGTAAWLATAASALWWLHPIQHSSVAYLANRDLLLLACGSFGTLWCLCRTRIAATRWPWYIAMTVFAWLTVATSSVGAVIVLQIALCDFLLHQDGTGSWLKQRSVALALATSSLVCLWLPSFQYQGDDFLLAERHWTLVPLLFAESLGHWFWPMQLNFDYLRPATHSTMSLWLAWGTLIGVLAAGVYFTRRFLLARLLLTLAVIGLSSFAGLPLFDARPELLNDARLVMVSACLAAVVVVLLFEGIRAILPEKRSVALLVGTCGLVCVSLPLITYQQLENYRSAEALWQSVLEIQPHHPRAHQRLGAWYAQEGETELAIQHYQQSLELWPQRAATHNALGAEFVKQQRWEEAEELFQQALVLDPKLFPARKNLANALMQQGDFTQAERQYQKLVQQRPQSAEVHLLLGSCYMRYAQFQKAAEELRLAVKYDPTSAVAHCNLGSVVGVLGDVTTAKMHLNKAIELNPRYAEAHYNLAAVLERDFQNPDRLQQAWDHVHQAVEYKPDYLDARLKLANWYYQANQISAALTHLKVALEADPENPAIHHRLGIAYSELKQEPKAIEHFRKVVDLQPQSFQAVLELGWRLAAYPDGNLRDGEEAVRLAKELGVSRQPNSPQMWDLLGAGYAEQGRFEEAIEAARRAINFAVEAGDQDLALDIQYRLMFYQQGRPFRTKEFSVRRQASSKKETDSSTY